MYWRVMIQQVLDMGGKLLFLALLSSIIYNLIATLKLFKNQLQKKKSRNEWIHVAASLAIFLLSSHLLFTQLPKFVDRTYNGIVVAENEAGKPSKHIDHSQWPSLHTITPTVKAEIDANYMAMTIIDLHCDALLWPTRDLLKSEQRGHVDIPRLKQANVAVQVLDVVSSVPKKMNFHTNDAPTLWQDSLTLKNMAELQPWSTITSRVGRVQHSAKRLNQLVEKSNHTLYFIKSQKDLVQYLERRELLKNQITAVMLAIEGVQALDGNIDNIDVIFEYGVRMVGFSHFHDTEFGGAASGRKKHGLTHLGRELLKRMEEKRIIVDLAHASEALIDDVLQLATQPVIVSHTGLDTICPSPRNLKDHHIKQIAETGGLIGITYFRPAVCGNPKDPLAEIVDQIHYAISKIGVDHVALGSDFDGAVYTPFDTLGVVNISAALHLRGYAWDEVAKVMGGNVLRFFLEYLPES